MTDKDVDYNTPGSALKGIEAAGIYFRLSRTAASGAPRFNLTAFSADLTVDPQGTFIFVR